jgi:hypothetical protein
MLLLRTVRSRDESILCEEGGISSWREFGKPTNALVLGSVAFNVKIKRSTYFYKVLLIPRRGTERESDNPEKTSVLPTK